LKAATELGPRELVEPGVVTEEQVLDSATVGDRFEPAATTMANAPFPLMASSTSCFLPMRPQGIRSCPLKYPSVHKERMKKRIMINTIGDRGPIDAR